MKGTIRFNIREDKLLKSGSAPIELVYSVSNQRKYYNTGVKVIPDYWDSKSQRALYITVKEAKKLMPFLSPHSFYTQSEVEEINDSLESLTRELGALEKDCIHKKVSFSSETIINLLKESKQPVVKVEEPKSFVFDYIDKYIRSNSETRAKGSLSVYKALSVHLKDFEAKERVRVRFDKIDYSFFQSFQNFLIKKKIEQMDGTVRHLQNTTIAKQLSTLKTFLNYAITQEGVKIDKTLYEQFKIKKDPLEVIALTQEEFDLLYTKDLSENKRLEQVRDVFCFACVTGLRYSDIKQLRREHIKKDHIALTVTKTKDRLQVPLTSYSTELLDKYAGLLKPLPVISSQNLNKYIKELCKLVGIDESIEIVRYRGSIREAVVYPKYQLIHIHTGRKTFVTLSLEKGMSAEEVMSISGHSNYASFKRYVNITETRKKVVMLKAWDMRKSHALKVV